MKFAYGFILLALLAYARGQTLDMNTTSDSTLGSLVESQYPDGLRTSHHSSDKHWSSEKHFIAFSSPGFKGHKQVKKPTPGCYRLDGGAVGSFSGDRESTYAFHSDSRCKSDTLFRSSYAPVRRIDPVIYPRSVKIRKFDDDDDDDDGMPPGGYPLVTYTRENFRGDKQKVRSIGCQRLDGDVIRSFQGSYRYNFHDDRHCQSAPILTSRGGRAEVRAIRPKSVYIF